jgi:hypothetical protein
MKHDTATRLIELTFMTPGSQQRSLVLGLTFYWDRNDCAAWSWINMEIAQADFGRV